MGYSYSQSGRLCCDNCGGTGSTRKRRCPYTVTSLGANRLPYCPAPAYCTGCYAANGGSAGVHGQRCKAGAAALQADDDTQVARLKAGDELVRTAWGDWDPDTPAGMVRVRTYRWDGDGADYLMPADDYRGGGFISDYPSAIPVDDAASLFAAIDDLFAVNP